MKSKIHRCNCRNVWSVQNRKKKTIAKSVLLNGTWTTELKPERRYNPRGFVISNRTQDIITNPPAELINQFTKVAKLIYDKKNINFNIQFGEYLYFDQDGTCYVLQKNRHS
ncbi:hypothetical protein [Neobacillus sp. Marseille-QA0830]